MGDLWLPESVRPHRRPVQLSDLRVIVLIHKDTKRVLCFGMDDKPTRALARKVGCKVVEILHANEYDRWAKVWRQQSADDAAAEDYAYLERENTVRSNLRTQLRSRLSTNDGPERRAIESALHCLEIMEKRRQRYRAESFTPQEAFESGKNVGEELVSKIMAPKG